MRPSSLAPDDDLDVDPATGQHAGHDAGTSSVNHPAEAPGLADRGEPVPGTPGSLHTAVGQPDNNHPVTYHPVTYQPATYPPATSQPATSQPGAVPGAVPGAAQPGTSQPGGPPPSDAPTGDGLGDGWVTVGEVGTEEEAFAQDIQAIIAHAQSVGGSTGQPAGGTEYGQVPLPTGAVQGSPDQVQPPAATPGVGAGATHDVFEAMTKANAPSRFAQGPVALSVDFDRLDRALEDVRSAAPATPDDAAEQAVGGVDASPATPPGRPVSPDQSGEPVEIATDVADVAAITRGAGPFRLVTDTPLVPQIPGLSCHAAACASMVAWRDEMTPDATAVAAGTGYWERYADGRIATYPDVFETFGLAAASAGRAPSPTALRDLLDAHGPLFVAASPPGEHAVVVAGITGDGTSSGTVVDVIDPWAEGMNTFAAPNPGSTYSVPVATLLARVSTGDDPQILVAHLRKGMS